MGTDPFEEFEFKPLTEGLGFQKKKTAATPAATGLSTRGIDFTDTEESGSPFKAPLPRKETKGKPAAPSTPTPSPVDEILNTLQKNRKLEIELDRKHRQELRNPKTAETWKAAAPLFSPMLLDGMLITAGSLLCMIIMLVVTKVDLLRNLSNPDTEGMIYTATAALFLGIGSIYMIIHRIFLGYTPGEWAYDIRLGKPEQQNSAIYSLKAIARQFLIIATGVVILPLAGLVTGKDLAGLLSGMTLTKKA